MKIFLTGATGYVGSVVAERLIGKGHEVFGLARNEASALKLEEKKIAPVRAGLDSLDVIKSSAADADGVIHTAFSHDFADYDDAVNLDRSVIKAFSESMAQTNKPLIITSSSAVLGNTRSNEADEDYPFDINSSRLLRGEAERDTDELSQIGIRSIVLRLPLFVYGCGGSSFLPFVINQAIAEKFANYCESGEQKVSAVHVEDAADLYVLALETSTAKGIYNVAAESVSMKEINESAARLLNLSAKSISAEKAKSQFGKMFEFLSINNQLDSSKARRDLAWVPNSYFSILDEIENGSYRKMAV